VSAEVIGASVFTADGMNPIRATEMRVGNLHHPLDSHA
jgi:hypothetical protein